MPEELPQGFYAESNFFSTVAVGYKQNIQNPTYLDVNTLVGVTSAQELLADILAINNSLYNLLSTPKGSRIFQPLYGSNLMNLIHEPADDLTAWRIRNELIDAIYKWEPRVRLIVGETSVIAYPEGDMGFPGFKVQVAYEILISNIISKLDFVITQ
jgi:phage baseplate assembly protein W